MAARQFGFDIRTIALRGNGVVRARAHWIIRHRSQPAKAAAGVSSA
jgi:hypothetical protein